jgi:hypothetical protein
MVASVALGRDANDAVAALRDTADVRLSAAEFVEHAARGLEHALPGSGQHHPFTDPQEQRRLEARFDITQLVTQGGLRQIQADCRLRHAARVRNARDETKMADF